MNCGLVEQLKNFGYLGRNMCWERQWC